MSDRIPFCDLTRLHAPLRPEMDAAIARVLARGWFLRGPEVEAFEREWAEYCGQAYCVACNSGTDALTLAAMGVGLREADVPSNTLPLTAIGLQRGGARVTAAEVDEDGHMLNAGSASVPVLLYGRMPSAAESSCRLFDAAHAHGWRPPSHAVACWSFYPTKSLGALGDGGAVTTNDPALARAMTSLCGRDDVLRDHRQMTSRMDEIQAAVLRIKLTRLDEWLARRRQIAALYEDRLPDGVRSATPVADSLHHLFVVRTDKRDALRCYLSDHGVETKIHFPVPLHCQDAPWGGGGRSIPGAEAWCASVLSLPCYPGLTDQEVESVCHHIRRWAGSAGGSQVPASG